MLSLLGLPLSVALDRIRAQGKPLPSVVVTADPRGHTGTLRVVRADETALVAAAFQDRLPADAPEDRDRTD